MDAKASKKTNALEKNLTLAREVIQGADAANDAIHDSKYANGQDGCSAPDRRDRTQNSDQSRNRKAADNACRMADATPGTNGCWRSPARPDKLDRAGRTNRSAAFRERRRRCGCGKL